MARVDEYIKKKHDCGTTYSVVKILFNIIIFLWY